MASWFKSAGKRRGRGRSKGIRKIKTKHRRNSLKRGRSEAEQKTKSKYRRNSLKRARQAHFYFTDGKLRVDDPQAEHQSPRPACQVKSGDQEVERHSREKLDAALSLIDLSREAWVSDDPSLHGPDTATAPRALTDLDVQAALTLVKLSREDEALHSKPNGQSTVEPQVEHLCRQPAHHQPGTEAQEALRHSSKEWDAALSLIDFSRKAWVDDTLNPYTPDAAAATRRLSQLQHEDAELARHLTVEDAQAALTLVKLSRESAGQDSVAALQVRYKDRDVDADVTMSDGLDRERRGFSSMDYEGWVIERVRGLDA